MTRLNKLFKIEFQRGGDWKRAPRSATVIFFQASFEFLFVFHEFKVELHLCVVL